jgi:hypothetical protein
MQQLQRLCGEFSLQFHLSRREGRICRDNLGKNRRKSGIVVQKDPLCSSGSYHYAALTDCNSSKKFGKEIATHEGLWMVTGPFAMRPATAKAMAMR